MRIEHIAIWVKNLEEMKGFYTKYFEGIAGDKYHNSNKQFTSYFIAFENGARLELMHHPDKEFKMGQHLGLAHFAFSLGSKEKVDELTKSLQEKGFKVIDGPRTTGDGYYESVILDPEDNRIELTT